MDLEALVTDELREEVPGYALEWFEVEASSRRPPHATVVGDAARRTRSSRARSPATARSTRSSRRSTPPPAIDARLSEFHDRRRHRGPGRARRGLRRGRARRARGGGQERHAGRADRPARDRRRPGASRPTSSRRPRSPTCARWATRCSKAQAAVDRRRSWPRRRRMGAWICSDAARGRRDGRPTLVRVPSVTGDERAALERARRAGGRARAWRPTLRRARPRRAARRTRTTRARRRRATSCGG